MDERESPSPIRLLAELARPMIPGLIAVAVFAVTAGGFGVRNVINAVVLVVSVLSPFVAAYFVWSLVSYANRRDDPRRGKRPSDPP